MPTPTAITDLSQTAASNYPAGNDSPSVLDDVQRAHAAFIALFRDGKGQSSVQTIAGGATTDIGGINSQVAEVTGTPTITSFGTNYTGVRFVRFTGAATITHNGTLINLPGAANITTASGDSLIAVPNSTGNGWNIVTYLRGAYDPDTAIKSVTQTAGDSSTNIATTAFVAAAIATLVLVPVGTVIHVAAANAPSGYLKANGSTIGNASSGGTLRANADTTNLFTTLWTDFSNTVLPIQDSTGAASTRGASAAADFAANKRLPVPDLRGEFVRGLDDGRGVDTGRLLLSAQAQAFQAHTHDTPSFGGHGGSGLISSWDGTSVAGYTTSTSAGGAETRPRNIALLACIKF